MNTPVNLLLEEVLNVTRRKMPSMSLYKLPSRLAEEFEELSTEVHLVYSGTGSAKRVREEIADCMMVLMDMYRFTEGNLEDDLRQSLQGMDHLDFVLMPNGLYRSDKERRLRCDRCHSVHVDCRPTPLGMVCGVCRGVDRDELKSNIDKTNQPEV